MGLIVWYKVQIEEAGAAAGGLLSDIAAMFTGGLPVKVSNDVFSGQYILDAEISAKMKEGAAAGGFSVRLPNLPADVVDTLKSKHEEAVAGGDPLQAKIFLGYFEDSPAISPPSPVMTGVITRLKKSVDASGILITEIEGQETAGYRLRRYCDSWDRPGPVQVDTIVADIASAAGDVQVASQSRLNLEWPNFTSRAPNGLAALADITRRAEKPLLIRDNTIYLGNAVGAENGPDFDPDKNLVQIDEDQFNEEIRLSCPTGEETGEAEKAHTRTSYDAQILGDPALRAGQMINLKLPDEPPRRLRASEVEHIFSPDRGYVCQVRLVVAEPGELAGRRGGAQGVVDRFLDLNSGDREGNPAIDVGEVNMYQPGSDSKHLATLYYGQTPPPDAVSPSVEVEVNQATQLHDKPFLSPFAFHQCGLVTPIYPKMRALLAHNRNLLNDAIVAGFLWSENPTYARPQNQPGDYWLCLPTELGSDGLPTGKGVNDLTDSSGLRIIQAKGLHIQVGNDLLPDVGSRPTPPDDGTITIEHSSGTKITIASDGALKIETSNKDITLTNGSVNLKLSGAAVEVS
jgi:hypothetical protein